MRLRRVIRPRPVRKTPSSSGLWVRRNPENPEEVDFVLREFRAERFDEVRAPVFLPDLGALALEALRDLADGFLLAREKPPVGGL